MSQTENNIDPTVKEHRIQECVNCQEFNNNIIPHCQLANKPISQLTSEEQQTCPLNKW